MSKSATLIISAPEHDSNLYYACHFLAPDPIIYFEINGSKAVPGGGQKHLILNDLEIDRARLEARVNRIHSLSEIIQQIKKRKTKPKPPLTAHVVDTLLKPKKIRELIVPADFPAYFYKGFQKLGYAITIKPDPFFEKRLVKSLEEKKLIHHTLKQVEKVLGEAWALLEKSKIKGKYIYHGREKVTSESLKQLINGRLMELGCIASHTIISSGVQGSYPHHQGSGPILAHTPIIFDIFPRNSHSQYWGDMTRTIVKGRPSPEVKKMYQAVLEANTQCREMVSEGVSAKDVHQHAVTCFEKRGFKTGQINGSMQGFIHSTGHGLGLDIHELPSVSQVGGILKKGHVITIEPGLYYRKHGGIRIEDVIYVTKNGSEALTKFPRFLEIDR